MSTDPKKFSREIRNLIINALPEDTSLHGKVPELRHTYLPIAHMKALRRDSMLVVGIRGSGKSYWWAVLQQKKHRALIGEKLGINESTIISAGFGESPSPENYPGKDIIEKLLKTFEPRKIWQTIVIWHIGKHLLSELTEQKSWEDRVKWVKDHPEDVERCFFNVDNELERIGNDHIILFDALDRTADDWKTMHTLVRGLFQILLEIYSYKHIRLKIFVRPDQIEDPTVTAFPDSSKVLSLKTELYWPRNELYGLFWHYLANEPSIGHLFRDECAQIISIKWLEEDGVWKIPNQLRNDEDTQREIFHALTGPWMGRDRRRGFPYPWLPSHLSDARRQVSPRSFLAALRYTADDTEKKRSGHEYALHYESIKSGVQQASKIRVHEIQEDYPWVQYLMEPLSGISVPCSFEDIKAKWDEHNVLNKLQNIINSEGVRLPPANINSGPEGVLKDLISLGLVEPISNGRINLPDVYRVGYGMGRRGGVKPMAHFER